MASSSNAREDERLPRPTMPRRTTSIPTLLPAFELSSSSPTLPRPIKRGAETSPTIQTSSNKKPKYPTPVPTSSTAILSSSPPHLPAYPRRRPLLLRTVSALSERAPLGAVPVVTLDASGEPTLMGRSSNSSNYQLSTNKLISRVHVRAAYIAPSESSGCGKVEIVCLGWNAMEVHCQGKVWDLSRNDTFTSEARGTDIMVDVQDTRLLLRWPKIGSGAGEKMSTPDSEFGFESEHSAVLRASASPPSSPMRHHPLLQSPVSPSPAIHVSTSSMNLGVFDHAVENPVQVYEDGLSDQENMSHPTSITQRATQSTQHLSQLTKASFLSQEGEDWESPEDFEADQDEENDPVIHSFGPFGANILPRLANFNTGSSNPATPERHRTTLAPLKEASVSPQCPPSKKMPNENQKLSASPPKLDVKRKHVERKTSSEDVRSDFKGQSNLANASGDDHFSPQQEREILNHIINQLAFSRLASVPLSIVINNLPSSLRSTLDGSSFPDAIQAMLLLTSCAGVVNRQGKDAAGQKLESEYYYIPDFDDDISRREAVTEGLRKPGLRECRKSHKRLITGPAMDTVRRVEEADELLYE
ncbi:hypothetical protein MMC25_002911 [Agyrium rufum]|nr:hypothetical protein [Agyrium rufum]